ncbi:MAG TPA: transglycosylase domain-containing protein [Anaerolineales bacterium]
MPQTQPIVQRRRARRADERRVRSTRLRMGGIGLGMIISFLLALTILFAALAYANLTNNLPNVEILPALLNPPDGLLLQPTRVYDRTGQHLLTTFAPTDSPRRYLPLNPQNPQHLPDFLAAATVAVAQPDFWTSPGYTLAGLQNPDLHPTIAQKLVSDLLLYNEPSTLQRAIRERILAAQITAKYGRSQILEWYLNSADYGHYAFGADAASEYYFGTSAFALTPSESAVLAALSQSPSLNPFDARDLAMQRGEETIKALQALKLLSDADTATILASFSIPNLPIPESKNTFAPAFINLAINELDRQFTRERIERGGLNIITTLDYDLQNQASCVTLVYVHRLANTPDPTAPCNATQLLPSLPPGTTLSEPSASALVTDPESGQILAAVGETLRGNETAYLTAHDPGSLMEPFVYLTAFTRGMSPASLVWDIPSTSNAQNPDGQFHGPVRARLALVNDYLVPAAAIADQMGSDAIHRTETSFGLDGNSFSLLDMASAYDIFAAQGVRYGQPALITVLRVEGLDHSVWLDQSNPQAQPVTTPQLAYLINNILSDESARWPSLGHPNSSEIGQTAAMKYGQTSDGHDLWTVGYSPARLVAVWTATHTLDAPRLSPQLTVDLWSALMQSASQSLPAQGWSIPAGITTMNVCDPSGLLPTKDCPSIVSEVFLNGNEPVQLDNLYQSFTVNLETGYLATVFTPPQLVENKVFMMIPPEAQAWAKSANVPIAPTSYDAIQPLQINPDVNLSAPALFADVTGKVLIKGTAAGANFDRYRVLVGQGIDPQNWIQVGSDSTTPVNDGVLANWDTTGLSGLYAVQLQVVRTDQIVDTATIQVTVANNH